MSVRVVSDIQPLAFGSCCIYLIQHGLSSCIYYKLVKNGNRYRKKVHAILVIILTTFETNKVHFRSCNRCTLTGFLIATFQFFENQAENVLELTYYGNG